MGQDTAGAVVRPPAVRPHAVRRPHHTPGRPRPQALALLEDEALDVVVSAQVLNEFYWTATRMLDPKVPEDVAQDVVRGLALGRVVPVDAALVEEAIALSRRQRLSLWDAGIVVAAQRAGCRELLTEDLTDGQAFGAVTVRDPFA